MTALGAAVWRSLQEAESKAMERLLEAWDREIEANARALEKANREHTQKAKAEAALERLEASARNLRAIAEENASEQRASDAALSGAVESHLRGLVAQAASGADVGLAIPSGIRVAGGVGGTSPAEIAALAAEARTADEPSRDAAQRSALWALGAGLMPHPGDLAELLQKAGRDPSWQDGLTQIAERLDRTPAPDSSAPIQARAVAARAHLGALFAERRLLADYGGGRLLTLIARPGDLKADLPRPCPPLPGAPKMGQAGLNAMLDGLFAR